MKLKKKYENESIELIPGLPTILAKDLTPEQIETLSKHDNFKHMFTKTKK